MRIADKKTNKLEVKARSGNSSESSPYGKYWVMMERYQTIHRSWHCIAKRKVFLVVMWTSIERINKDDVDESATDKDVGFVFGGYGNQMELQPVSVDSVVTADGEQVNKSPTITFGQQSSWNQDDEEEWITPWYLKKKSA